MILYLSISSSLVILAFYLFRWSLADLFTVFLMPFIWIFTLGFFIVVLLLSIIGVIRARYWKPLLIQLLTILILFIVPINEIVLKVDFMVNKADRIEVISRIDTGELKPNVSHNASLIKLPEEYVQLSKGGGEIVIEGQGKTYSVLFFTFRGVLDGFSGFVFSPNGSEPEENDFGGDFKEIDEVDENWYFVVSY